MLSVLYLYNKPNGPIIVDITQVPSQLIKIGLFLLYFNTLNHIMVFLFLIAWKVCLFSNTRLHPFYYLQSL